MALDFPASPTNGQVYGAYVYDSSLPGWRSKGGAVAATYVSDTAPSGAVKGDMWYRSSDGTTYVYYVDADTSQWVEIRSEISTAKVGLVPVVPTSISVSSGSASVDTTGLVSATGWGTLKLQGVFTSAYRNYRVILDIQSTSIATEITGDLLTGSTTSGTAYRTWRPITGLTANTNVIYNYNDGVNWFNMGRSSATYGCLTIADIFAPNVSGTYKRFLGQTIEYGYQMFPGALNGTTAAYDGFQLAVSGTATTATVRVYGYN